MFKSEYLLSDGFPPELDWQNCGGLLIDAVTMLNLPHQLEQWTNAWVYEPLYVGSPMAALAELSPRILKVDNPQHPVLQQFLAHTDEEWGYLLFCDGPWQSLIDHLRWLTVVRMAHEQNVFLRLADPSVVHGLLKLAVEAGDATLFGPCKQILIADGGLGCWHLHQRPGPAPTVPQGTRYQLSVQQTDALDEVSFRNVVMDLNRHMTHYFPGYQAHVSASGRWEHLHVLAEESYTRGFNSKLDITLFANIHGYLGELALQDHPDLERLLTTPSALTPTQRIEKAADIARRRALNLQEPS